LLYQIQSLIVSYYFLKEFKDKKKVFRRQFLVFSGGICE